MSARRNPQQKKQDSYRRDRRNAYGQHDKASRRLIALKKRLGERAHRRAVHQAVHLPAGGVLGALVADVDDRVASTGPKLKKRFQKARDVALGVHLQLRRPRGGAPFAKHVRRIRWLEQQVGRSSDGLAALRQAILVLKSRLLQNGDDARSVDELRRLRRVEKCQEEALVRVRACLERAQFRLSRASSSRS